MEQTQKTPPNELPPTTKKWLSYLLNFLSIIGGLTFLMLFMGLFHFWGMITAIALMVPILMIPYFYPNAIHFANDNTSFSIDGLDYLRLFES